MTEPLTISALRTEMKLTLEQFCPLVGLRSIGHLSQIEAGKASVSLDVALEIEKISGGRINAADLCDDVRKAREACAQCALDAAE